MTFPVNYGAACPDCDARYGEPNRMGWIDVAQCPQCIRQRDARLRKYNDPYFPLKIPRSQRNWRRIRD